MFKNRDAIIATMHHKEKVIAPPLQEAFHIKAKVCPKINTDLFGTFTREVPRAGDMLDAARLKVQKAHKLTGKALILSSEGSFGPHPTIPFLRCDHEMVLLKDFQNNIEIIGQWLATETNFNHQTVQSADEGLQFAEKCLFPSHGIIVRYSFEDNETIEKNCTSMGQLKQILDNLFNTSHCSKIALETDMRALRNPTRMNVIKHATMDLIQKMKSHCPACDYPGFSVTESIKGLPCEWCGYPTECIQLERYGCTHCDYKEDRALPDKQKAYQGHCPMCNP